MIGALLMILALVSFVFLVWAIIERNGRLYWQDEYYKLQASLQSVNTKDNGMGVLVLVVGVVMLVVFLLLLFMFYPA